MRRPGGYGGGAGADAPSGAGGGATGPSGLPAATNSTDSTSSGLPSERTRKSDATRSVIGSPFASVT